MRESRGGTGRVVKVGVVCFLVSTYLLLTVIKAVEEVVIRDESHCSNKCGDVTIPYPFGIEDGCYYRHDHEQGLQQKMQKKSYFQIYCNRSSSPHTPIFGSNLEVTSISVEDGEFRFKNNVAYQCFSNFTQTGINNNVTHFHRNSNQHSINLGLFTLSRSKNALVVMGCDTYAWFNGTRFVPPFNNNTNNNNYSSGCMTTCVGLDNVIDGECSGIGCCLANFPSESQYINVTAHSFQNHISVHEFNPCSVAFPVEKNKFRFRRQDLSRDVVDYITTKYPVVIDWAIPGKNCSEAKADNTSLCNRNAVCHDLHHGMEYRCSCKPGFRGNPYLPFPLGCPDIDECKDPRLHNCQKAEYCVNTNGHYYCQCPNGHRGSGTTEDPCISNSKPWLIPTLATAGVGGSIITILVIGILFYWKQEQRQLKKTRATFFQQNGGLLLHEKLSDRNNIGDTLKIFTTQDLENASNNYCDDNIIGRGGFGVVYKGILPNKQIVAIKKSLRVDPSQVEQFINEVLILSQIRNKYVVKLLGCCLETEVPLLVYEFINNGTLYDHLHDDVKASTLAWPMRLKIASQVANVLSYLHHTITMPIIHRDMKSMNILLDECYTAKVIDFGASRLTPSDQSQFATMVIGTRGYLDPEYMQMGKLTEKSDVYSFGVVLVELLTREKAIYFETSEIEKYLAMHFLVKMRDDRLMDIVDKNIVSENNVMVEQLKKVANLAKWCLMLKGEERPTMKEVAIELETIIGKGSHPWNDINNGGSSSLHDCESLLVDYPRSADYGGCSFDIESNVYDSELISALGSGR